MLLGIIKIFTMTFASYLIKLILKNKIFILDIKKAIQLKSDPAQSFL